MSKLSDKKDRKAELYNDMQVINNSDDYDQEDFQAVRDEYNTVKGEIKSLEAQEEEDKRNAVKISGNGERKKDVLLNVDEKLANSHRSSAENQISPESFFEAAFDEPKNDKQAQVIQNSTTSSGYSLPEFVSAELVDMIRAKNPILQLGGKTSELMGDTTFVTIKNNPEVKWHQELNEEALDNTDVFGNIKLDPYTALIVTDVSREVLNDGVNVGDAIVTALTGSISDAMVKASFQDAGANAPNGLDTLVSQKSFYTNGTEPENGDIIKARKKLFDANVAKDDHAAIYAPDFWQSVAGETNSNNDYVNVPEAVSEIDKQVSSGLVGGTSYVGDFSNVVYGFSLNMTVERQAVPRKFGMRFLSAVRYDMAVLRPDALVRIEESPTT